MTVVEMKYAHVDGVKTHYLEAGVGPNLVLLHSGEFGGAAEISWEFNIGELAEHFHVLAPDFVGFGRSDKLRDFEGHGRRMIHHITQFLQTFCVEEADFIGNSVSGRFLSRIAAQDHPVWPIRRMILVSGGGFEPDNEARRVLQDYDATLEGMGKVVSVLFYDKKWSQDDAYVQRRYEMSILPGAWEVAAAARFKSPIVPERPQFGRPDMTAYEKIRVPTLVVAGANDSLLEARYALAVGSRTPDAEILELEHAGHCPHIECAEQFNRAALQFLTK